MEKRKKKRGNRTLLSLTTPAAAAVRVMLLAVFLTMMLGFSSVIQAQTITVTEFDWNVTVPPITEAGADYGGTYENPADLTLSGSIPGDLLVLLSGGGVQVTVEKAPSIWHSSLRLYVKRAG